MQRRLLARHLLDDLRDRILWHRLRLRRIARIVGFALPAVLTFLGLLFGGASGAIAAGLAIVSAALGLVVERWLFFAEAKHTVTLYYGAEAV